MADDRLDGVLIINRTVDSCRLLRGLPVFHDGSISTLPLACLYAHATTLSEPCTINRCHEQVEDCTVIIAQGHGSFRAARSPTALKTARMH